MEIKVISPDNGQPVTIEDWAKESDPKRAEFILITNDEGKIFKLYKSSLGRYSWDEAQEKVKEFGDGSYRCTSRKESIDLYDARFRGLDKALELIGGDPVRGCMWTCEEDPDPEYSQDNAFSFNGDSGIVNAGSKYSTYAVRALSALEKF
jgi:hypothetical protein